MKGWEWAIIIIVVLLIVILIIAAIWYFSIRERGLGAGERCTHNTHCAEGLYCDSSGICRTGRGKREGESCSQDDDCLIGFTCLDNRCSSHTSNNTLR